jgi:hypothetical protein
METRINVFENNHFYFILLGKLYKGFDNQMAKTNFQNAYALAKTDTEKHDIQKRIGKLRQKCLNSLSLSFLINSGHLSGILKTQHYTTALPFSAKILHR